MSFVNTPKQAISPVKEGGVGVAEKSTEEAFDVSGSSGVSLAMLLCWVTAFVAIGGSIFFWLLNNSAKDALKSKQQEKAEIINQIASPELADIELQATAFKSAVTELTKINQSRYSVDNFITKFYGKIAKNVQVGNVTLDTEGKLSMTGVTSSYKAVGEQMMLLKDWKVNNENIIKNLELGSVAQGMNDSTKKVEVTFLINGLVDKTKSLEVKTAADLTQSAGLSGQANDEEGGLDATLE